MEEIGLTVQKDTEIAAYGGSMYDRAQMADLVDEVVASVKDSRLNTKRAVFADIASTARVQNLYGQYVAACERELHRKDLPEESRKEILDNMYDACRASESASVESRGFQREQLEQSHMLPWKILGVVLSIVVSGYIGGAVYRAARE